MEQGVWPSSRCPRKCLAKEDTLHVLQCPCSTHIWLRLQRVVVKWGANNNLASGLESALFVGLTQ
eukprot:713015-Ditylum_brightwellii.AAC.1